MHCGSKSPAPAKTVKAAAKVKRASSRSNASSYQRDPILHQHPVQISIFEFAVSIGVPLFPEQAAPLATEPHRRRKKSAA